MLGHYLLVKQWLLYYNKKYGGIMVKISNLHFEYKNKVIFDEFNLEIKDKSIVSIIGQNGSGKSTLVKILVGLLDFDGEIIINDTLLNKTNLREIRKNIGIVFENPDNQIVKEIVYDDIAYTLNNMNVEDVKSKVLEIAEYLGIVDILYSNINSLNVNQKQLVCLASALVRDPQILILDESLALLDAFEKDKVLNLLKDLKRKGLTIINITHDIEDTLISDEIIVVDKGKVVLKGRKNKVYKSEKILKPLGFDLPFMVELSNRLMFYGLIDHVIYDMEEMVDILWQ